MSENDFDFILKKKDVRKLFRYLEKQLDKESCDNTLKYTKKWVEDNFPNQYDEIIEEIEDEGGYCDCEVLMNCYEDYEL